MEAKDRIKQICAEKKMSQRKFAQSIGLHPTSLAPIISGKSAVSQVLANSIELKHKYSAEWILTGEGEKFSVAESKQEQFYNNMLSYAADGLFDERGIGVFAEAGMTRWFEKDIAGYREIYIDKMRKEKKYKKEDIFCEVGKKTMELAELNKELQTTMDTAFENLNSRGRIVFMLDIYLVIMENVKADNLKLDDFKLYYVAAKTYSSKVLPHVKAATKLIYKMYELWEA